jgi:hypothetical protein
MAGEGEFGTWNGSSWSKPHLSGISGHSQVTVRTGSLACLSRSFCAAAAQGVSFYRGSTGAPKTSGALSVFMSRLEADLAQLASGRATLTAALVGVRNCSIPPAAARLQLAGVVSNREQTLRALAHLGSPDARTAQLTTLLRLALSASIASDRDYEAWLARAKPGSGCPLPHDANYRRAQGEDAIATTAKKRFLAAFNPLARTLHLRTWSAATI